MEAELDGNAAAGMLQTIFPFDMTLVQVTCDGCHSTYVIAELAVYMHGMGIVLRCPSCENVLIRVAQIEGDYLLDMHGVQMLRIPADNSPGE